MRWEEEQQALWGSNKITMISRPHLPTPWAASCPPLPLPFGPVSISLLLTINASDSYWLGVTGLTSEGEELNNFLMFWLCCPWCSKTKPSSPAQPLKPCSPSLSLLLPLKTPRWAPSKDHLLQKGFPDCRSPQWCLPSSLTASVIGVSPLMPALGYREAKVPILSLHHITWTAGRTTDLWVPPQGFWSSKPKAGLENLQSGRFSDAAAGGPRW